MPLVGGNELSFLSISFTICFYLVINESSVWWQQAAGCLLTAALSSLSDLAMFPFHTRADAAEHARTSHAHNHTFIQRHEHVCHCAALNPGCSGETLKHSSHTPALFFHIHIIRSITSIILLVLLCPKNMFLIIVNYP